MESGDGVVRRRLVLNKLQNLPKSITYISLAVLLKDIEGARFVDRGA